MLKTFVALSLATVATGTAPVSRPRPQSTLPFTIGERLEYRLSFGRLRVGSGHMALVGIDTIDHHATWHAVLTVSGGIPFFHVNDTTSSWFDTSGFVSRRFVQHLNEGPYHVRRDFRIDPERRQYTKNDEPTTASTEQPLDDVSMIYFVRTLPLATGDQYVQQRYFQPEGNPVVIRVVRRERITVPAGTFPAIVIAPEIRTSGLFGQGGHAELWFSDDSARVLLQMKAGLMFGSINLYLSSVTHR